MIFNRYSFIIIALILITVLTVVGWRFFGIKFGTCTLIISILTLITFQLTFSSTSDKYSNFEDFNKNIYSGKTVLLFLYSNFWVACLSAKPGVDRLESQINNQITVIRINIQADIGNKVKEQYNLTMVPSFVIFNSQGKKILEQSGIIPTKQLISSLDLSWFINPRCNSIKN